MATVPNFTDLNKLPPRAQSYVNDTTLKAPKVPKVPQGSLGSRVGTALGKFAKPLAPFARAIPGVGAALGIGGTLMSDVDKTAENRTFPKAGAVADETRRLQGNADGFVAREMEGLKGALPLVGGLMTDVYDRVSSYYGDEPNLGPGIELTPGAAEGVKTQVPYRGTSAESSTSTSQGQPAIPGAQQPVAPVAKQNDSYFINNQTGEAPGEKQLFRDLPGTTLNDPQAAPQLPQRLPGDGQGVNQPYRSPLAEAAEGLNLARFDASTDSYGDLLGKRLQNVNEGGKLIPALAETREQAEQQRRNEGDRAFGLDSLRLNQDQEYQTNNLALGRDELEGQNSRARDANLVALRGQNVTADTRRAIASAKGTGKPLTYRQQLEERESIIELGGRLIPTAPVELLDAMPDFVKQGATPESVAKAYREVMAMQEQNTGSTEAPTAEKLMDAITKRLNQ